MLLKVERFKDLYTDRVVEQQATSIVSQFQIRIYKFHRNVYHIECHYLPKKPLEKWPCYYSKLYFNIVLLNL